MSELTSDVIKKSSQGEPSRSAESWQHFAAAAGASLFGITTADAAIVHIIPPTPMRLELSNNRLAATSQTTLVDLNHDDLDDLRLQLRAGNFTSTTVGTSFTIQYQYANGMALEGGNARLFGGEGAYSWVRRFETGETIGAGNAISSAGFRRMVDAPGLQVDGGHWPKNGSGLGGVQFDIDGQDHYGWIRVNLESDNDGLRALELAEWAFQDQPGTTIPAGLVPEPSGLAGLALGAAGVLAHRQRRRSSASNTP